MLTMNSPRLANLILLGVMTMCHGVCAGDLVLACCDDSACTDTDGGNSAPAAPCFCSGAVLPHSEPSAARAVLAHLVWADPVALLNENALSVATLVEHTAWSGGPPADHLVLPLLI
jgi:hypothetical protein